MLIKGLASHWEHSSQFLLLQFLLPQFLPPRALFLRPLQDWLDQHPWVAWLWEHPLWAAAVAGGSLLLLAGLWNAIARLTEQFWLTLASVPFRLLKWVFSAAFRMVFRYRSRIPADVPAPDRLTTIMGRLESLQAEQAELVQEMRRLLTEQGQGQELEE